MRKTDFYLDPTRLFERYKEISILRCLIAMNLHYILDAHKELEKNVLVTKTLLRKSVFYWMIELLVECVDSWSDFMRVKVMIFPTIEDYHVAACQKRSSHTHQHLWFREFMKWCITSCALLTSKDIHVKITKSCFRVVNTMNWSREFCLMLGAVVLICHDRKVYFFLI